MVFNEMKARNFDPIQISKVARQHLLEQHGSEHTLVLQIKFVGWSSEKKLVLCMNCLCSVCVPYRSCHSRLSWNEFPSLHLHISVSFSSFENILNTLTLRYIISMAIEQFCSRFFQYRVMTLQSWGFMQYSVIPWLPWNKFPSLHIYISVSFSSFEKILHSFTLRYNNSLSIENCLSMLLQYRIMSLQNWAFIQFWLHIHAWGDCNILVKGPVWVGLRPWAMYSCKHRGDYVTTIGLHLPVCSIDIRSRPSTLSWHSSSKFVTTRLFNKGY